MMRCIAAFFLLALPVTGGAAAFPGTFTPGEPYYFESFDPEQRPWEPGQGLNIEEVFKNYEYYEIVLEQDGKGLTVNHYVSGSRAGSVKYRVLPDGSLQKNEP